MTRQQILSYAVQHAMRNGFDFRRWFQYSVNARWTTVEAAVELLADKHNYYALIFSHEFAESFWKVGSQITIMIPAISYTVRDKEGKLVTIHRKAYARRTLKADSWRYHMREMVDFPQPLKYLRRFIVSQEDLETADREREEAAGVSGKPVRPRTEAVRPAPPPPASAFPDDW